LRQAPETGTGIDAGVINSLTGLRVNSLRYQSGPGPVGNSVTDFEMLMFSNAKPLIVAATTAILAVVLFGGLPGAAKAEIKKPAGDVVLVITGKISETNAGAETHFDREMLTSLGMETLKTTTPFEEGVQTFEGPRVDALLKSVGATGELLVATALDGYTVEIPMQDVVDYPVLLAMVWNGETMGVRNKGPLWIIYPIDQYHELARERFSARSIWQLNRIDIR